MLLSDSKLRTLLQDKVVPAWEAVRPAPKVTIDFGDGKRLERTLKGNTVLYLCTPDGKVIDAFPAVYTASDFLREVEPALVAFDKQLEPAAWHKGQVAQVIDREHNRVMMAKAFVESPLLEALGKQRRRGLANREAQPAQADGELALGYQNLVSKLSDMSEEPASAREMKRKVPKQIQNDPESLGRWVVEQDSAFSVKLLRPAVHMLLSLESSPTPASLRDRMFKEVLQVPLDDPYLGLGDLVVPGTAKPKG